MNIIWKLTLRYMKQSRRRTLVTIIGIIISVAMMTAVTTAGASFLNLYERRTIANEGKFHVIYHNVAPDQTQVIIDDENTEEALISVDLGYTASDSQNEYKPYLFFKAYNPQSFDMVPLTLTEGRLPQTSSEVVIPEHLASNGKVEYEVGDQMTVDLCKRIAEGSDGTVYELDQSNAYAELYDEEDQLPERLEPTGVTQTYTGVGKVDRPSFEEYWAPGYTIITAYDDNSPAVASVNVSVWAKHVGSDFYSMCDHVAEKAGISTNDITYNFTLLMLAGVSGNSTLLTTIYVVMALLLLIIMISSVSLIYNAFAISMTERSRWLGLLAGVGATKRQKRESVFFEGALTGAVSIPLGIIAGVGGLAVAFHFVSPMIQSVYDWDQPLYVVISWPAIAAAAAVSAVTIFISVYIPARRASKISPIDSIRQSRDIKLTRRTVKTSRLTGKIFGFEGELALKNLKRNKKRYRVTVISLAVSLILFLSVSGFVHVVRRSYEMMYSHTAVDFTVYGSDENIADCRQMPGVSRSVLVTRTINDFYFPDGLSHISEDYRAQWIRFFMDYLDVGRDEAQIQVDNYKDFALQVYALDEENMQQYLADNGMDSHILSEQGSCILLNQVIFSGRQSRGQVNVMDMAAGDLIPTYYYAERTDENGEAYSEVTDGPALKIAAAADQMPWNMSSTVMGTNAGVLQVLVSEETLNWLINLDESLPAPQQYLEIASDAPEATLAALEDYGGDPFADQFLYNSSWETNRNNENELRVISIFTYGFIILMTAICTANILNTTATSISLRRKEFAMLRSVGMTQKAFNKMIIYESLLYGIKALIFGLPAGFVMIWLIYNVMNNNFYQAFSVPWFNVIFAMLMIFLITGTSMMYAVRKVRKENVVEALKGE